MTSNRNIKFFDNYRIYHDCKFNKFYGVNDAVRLYGKSLELGATFLLSYHSHERGTNRESKKELNRRIVGKSLHSYHPTISLCQTMSSNWELNHRIVGKRLRSYHTAITCFLNDVGFGELNRRIVGMVGTQRAPPSVEFSRIANKSGQVKPVKLVKKLRGGCLGVELWVSVPVNYIASGVIYNSFYKCLAETENMNNLLNLLNFSTTGW